VEAVVVMERAVEAMEGVGWEGEDSVVEGLAVVKVVEG
jgi:hypothetical protein